MVPKETQILEVTATPEKLNESRISEIFADYIHSNILKMLGP